MSYYSWEIDYDALITCNNCLFWVISLMHAFAYRHQQSLLISNLFSNNIFLHQDKCAPKFHCNKKIQFKTKIAAAWNREVSSKKKFLLFFLQQLILDNAQKVLMRYFPSQLSNTHAISFLHYLQQTIDFSLNCKDLFVSDV